MQRAGESELLVRVLGDVGVRASEERAWVQLPPQQRLLTAALVTRLGATARVDQLVDALWGDRAPPHARRLVQGLVSRLRRVLDVDGQGGSRLRSAPGGWQLTVEPETVDVTRFDRRTREARAAMARGDRSGARQRFDEALGLWCGRPFGDLADHPFLTAEAIRLEEQRLVAWERLLELRIDAGEPDEAIGELQTLVAAHPMRERSWGLLMQALYRSGRQADALEAYRGVRDRLVTELGTEPGPQLQHLHGAILRHEASLAPSSDDETPPAPPPRRRSPPSWPCRRDLPLAGRDRALQILRDELARARRGDKRLVLVGGEAGVGKTRLVAELADVAVDAGFDVLAGRCTEGVGAPYEPFVEALRSDVDTTGDAWLPGRLGRDAGELARMLPDLAARTGQTPPPPSISPALDQHRLFQAVAGWLTAAAAQAPLMLVLEDLHAATRPTLVLLEHVARATRACPLLLVVTYRDTGEESSTQLEESLAQLTRHPGVARLQLLGLDEPAVARLFATRGVDPARQADWAATMHAATAGNPLFVEELLNAIAAERLTDPGQLPDHLEAPREARELLQARIRRLSPAAVRLLRHAAVAGDEFDFGEATQAAALEEHDALRALEEASAARLISATDAGGDRYRFVHTLMRTALLDAITPSRRVRLHARLAAALEARHADDVGRVAGRLAHHHTAAGPAGDGAKVVTHAVAAGDAAMAQRAYDEAAAWYERALPLLEPGEDERRCDLLIRLGQAHAGAGHPDQRSTLLQATRLAIDLGEPDRVARAAFAGSRGFFSQIGGVDAERVALLHDALALVTADDPGPRAQLLALLANELLFTADLARRRRLTDEALGLARRQPDAAVRGRVLALRQLTIQHPATLHERLHETAWLIDLSRHLDDPVVETLAHTWRFLAVLETGDRPQAEAAMDEARRLADGLGYPMLKAFVLTIDARELLWGDLERAARLADDYRGLGRNAGMGDVDCPYLAQQFYLHRERGRLAEYRPLLDRALDAYGMLPAWQATAGLARWLTGEHDAARAVLERYAVEDFAGVPHDFQWADALCLFGELAALAGARDAARTLLRLLAPYHDRLTVDPAAPVGAVAYYLGLLATTVEEWQQACDYLDAAADIHQRVGAHRWHNRTLLARARIHLARNDPGDHRTATRLVRVVAERARRGGQIGLLDEAERLVPGRAMALAGEMTT